ncbi:MAG: 5'/3'-nucleotidase SurE [Campylobacteraceae bacterium 4484_166]|nr:MAG: 5'/3'-nucleotidase SurE [Campylobacteraceae bacterium 4484_166]
MKKTVLITNDDGFDAVGLQMLKEAISSIANIVVVAPLKNKSACGHSMTLVRPLTMSRFDDDCYTIDGTPTDCVFVSLHTLFKEIKPDLVISGINIGSNMGEDITYSGTAAAAMEASLHKIDSIAISQVINSTIDKHLFDYGLAKETIFKITKKILNGSYPLEERKFLNINIPPIKADECKGIKITNAGKREYGDDIRTHHNPRGELYYWIGLHPLRWNCKDKSCDFEAINDGFVSITPISIDMTSYDDIKRMKKWL